MTRALLALLLLAPAAHAQWAWDARLGLGAERADNLFRTADVLVADDAPVDSSALDALVVPLTVRAEVQRTWGRQSLALRYDLGLNRYPPTPELDGEDHAVRLTADAERGAVDVRAEGRWQHVERVGTNALADDRPQLLQYDQPEAMARARWTPSLANRVTLRGRIARRAYAWSANASSLDHRETEAEAVWRLRRRADRRTRWQVETSVGIRDRAYQTLLSRDAEGARDSLAYPASRLRYFDAAVDAERALLARLTASASVGARTRQDRFEGYYSYRSASLGAGLEWTPHDAVEVEVAGRYRWIGYTVQEAPQESGPAPLLRYRYLGGEIAATVRAAPGVQVTGFVEATRRLSNVTRESLRFRRSYLTSVVGVSVAVDLREVAGRQD